MKKLLLITFFMVVATLTAPAQMVDDIYYSPQTNKKQLVVNATSADTTAVKAYELDYMRYCLGKYHKARQNAYLMSGASLALSFTAMQFNDSDTQETMLIASGIGGLTSVVLFVVAEKWLKRSAIKPSPNGLGVVVEF